MYQQHKNRFVFLSKIILCYCFLQYIFRTFLLGLVSDNASYNIFELLKTFALGFTYDITIAMFFSLPLALFILLNKTPLKFWSSCFYQLLLLIFFSMTVFTDICEYYFWEEFHARFNFIAVDYLVYTHELLGNILEAYPVVPLVLLVLVISIGLTYNFNRNFHLQSSTLSLTSRFKAFGIYVITLTIITIGLNSGMTRFVSNNVYNQELAGNGVFQLFHAFFQNELDYERLSK